MTPLAEKIVNLIQQSGPLRISDYFAMCLADPDYGYYQTRNPFGEAERLYHRAGNLPAVR